MKKNISSALILFMSLSLAAPVLVHSNCTMPCCEKIEMSCCVQQNTAECPMEMSSCDRELVILLLSGPKAEFKQQIDLSALTQLGSSEVKISTANTGYHPCAVHQESPPLPFRTPLRI